MSPQLSIIIPVYNTEMFIERCLISLLNQTLKNVEIIIINDMSTDHSIDIVNHYIKSYSNISLYHAPKKLFCGGARNIGLQVAKGEYIGFVDSDDWVDTNMFGALFKSAVQNNADVSLCGVKNEYESSKETNVRYEYNAKNVIDGAFALSLLSRSISQDIAISPVVWNKIYRADFLKENKLVFIENNCNDDDVFSFLIFLYAKIVSIVPNTFYHYYQRYDSIMHTISQKNIDDIFNAFMVIKNHLKREKRYDVNKKNYYDFFEKCFLSVLDIINNSCKSSKERNEYIAYAYQQSQGKISISEYIDHVGFRRIRRFLLP